MGDNCNWHVDNNNGRGRHWGCAPLKAAYSPAPIKTKLSGYTYCLEHGGTDDNVDLARCTGERKQDWFWIGASLRNMDLGRGWCLDHTVPPTTWVIGKMKRCNGRTTQQWTTVREYPNSQGIRDHKTFVISAKDRYLPLKPFLAGLTEAYTIWWERLGEVQVAGR